MIPSLRRLGNALRRQFPYLAPMLAWMAVIAVLSTDIGAHEHTTDGLFTVTRFLFPDLERTDIDEEVRFLSWTLRKLGHLCEYAVLSFLACRWLLFSFGTSPQIWRGGGLTIASIYAALDECHQLLVPTRSGSLADVMTDLAGAALGTLWFALHARGANTSREQGQRTPD